MPDPNPIPIRWMQGFPPPPEARLSFRDGSFYSWPQRPWTFSKIGQVVPTRTAWRGSGLARVLHSQASSTDEPLAGGDRDLFARGNDANGGRYGTMNEWSYRSQWWIRYLEGRTFPMTRDARGQMLAISQGAELVGAAAAAARQPPSGLMDAVTDALS